MTTTLPNPEEVTETARFAEHIEVHDSIEGTFAIQAAATWDSLMCSQESRNITGHMLEIGVCHGKSATLLALHADPQNEVCVLVDKSLEESSIDAALLKVRPELDPTIQYLQTASRRLLVDPLITEGFESFRWIHNNGERSAGAVTSDLVVAHSLLAPGGIICLDGFFNWLYPQITEAVLRYVRENPDHFSLFLCGYNKAYLARPHAVHLLHEHCKDALPAALEARGIDCTVSKTTCPAELNTFGMGPRQDGTRLRGPDWEPHAIRI
jgi:predicted O-methyltransferase YrrM